MEQIGKYLVVAGLALALIGFVVWKFHDRLPLGRLPGDIVIEKGNFGFYFPIVTCIVISVVLTLIMWLFRR